MLFKHGKTLKCECRRQTVPYSWTRVWETSDPEPSVRGAPAQNGAWSWKDNLLITGLSRWCTFRRLCVCDVMWWKFTSAVLHTAVFAAWRCFCWRSRTVCRLSPPLLTCLSVNLSSSSQSPTDQAYSIVSDVVEKTSTRRRSRIHCVVVEKITTRRREGVGVVVEKIRKSTNFQ